MATVDQVKNKIQRMLTNRFGTVKIDKDGDFVVVFESAVVFVRVSQWTDTQTIVTIQCPLVVDVKISPELTFWIASEGQKFIFGSCRLNPDENQKSGWIYFEHNLLGDDLDEPELMEALDAVVLTSNKLDNELVGKFGGKLFGSAD
jgi:hypothetical protein